MCSCMSEGGGLGAGGMDMDSVNHLLHKPDGVCHTGSRFTTWKQFVLAAAAAEATMTKRNHISSRSTVFR